LRYKEKMLLVLNDEGRFGFRIAFTRVAIDGTSEERGFEAREP
jgi:hypothetical protein